MYFRTTIRGLFSLSLYLWYIISLWTCVSWLSWCLPLPLLLQCPWSLFSFAFVSFFTPISIFNFVLLLFVLIIIIIIIIIVVISMDIIFAMIVVIMFVILILFILSLMFILFCIETLKLYGYTQRSAAQTIVFVYTFFLCAKVWTARCYNSNHQMRCNASRRCGEKGPKKTLYNLWLFSSRGRILGANWLAECRCRTSDRIANISAQWQATRDWCQFDFMFEVANTWCS